MFGSVFPCIIKHLTREAYALHVWRQSEVAEGVNLKCIVDCVDNVYCVNK